MSRMRAQVLLWSAALVITLVPEVMTRLSSGHLTGFMVMLPNGGCQAFVHEYEIDNLPVAEWIRDYPFVLVGLAFAAWLRTRWRWVAWATALVLTVEALLKPTMMAYDVALWGEQCRRAWGSHGGFHVVDARLVSGSRRSDRGDGRTQASVAVAVAARAGHHRGVGLVVRGRGGSAAGPCRGRHAG